MQSTAGQIAKPVCAPPAADYFVGGKNPNRDIHRPPETTRLNHPRGAPMNRRIDGFAGHFEALFGGPTDLKSAPPSTRIMIANLDPSRCSICAPKKRTAPKLLEQSEREGRPDPGAPRAKTLARGPPSTQIKKALPSKNTASNLGVIRENQRHCNRARRCRHQPPRYRKVCLAKSAGMPENAGAKWRT